MFFWGALACSVFVAVGFAIGWLWCDHEVTNWIQGGRGLDSSEEGELAEARYLSDTCLLLLKVVPASIVAAWGVVSWIVFGPEAFRLETIKSHFSALLK
jgi:hypothetical protein